MEILTETKMPDVDLAITSGIWLFLQADQCGVARNARLTPVESIDRPAISPASLMSLACSSRAVELAGFSALRSVITPFCQMNARQLPSAAQDSPTTWR